MGARKMTVKITIQYNAGSDHGKTVTVTETWVGNVIPLGKIHAAIAGVTNGKLEKTKVVRVTQ